MGCGVHRGDGRVFLQTLIRRPFYADCAPGRSPLTTTGCALTKRDSYVPEATVEFSQWGKVSHTA